MTAMNSKQWERLRASGGRILVVVLYFCYRTSNDGSEMGDRDEDLSPESKAERERMRRQANNARERWVCTTFCFFVHSFSFAYVEVCRAVEMMTTTTLISVPSLKRSVSVCVDKLITTERGTIYTNTLTNTQHRRPHGRAHGPAWICRCVVVVLPVFVQLSIHRSSGQHEASPGTRANLNDDVSDDTNGTHTNGNVWNKSSVSGVFRVNRICECKSDVPLFYLKFLETGTLRTELYISTRFFPLLENYPKI